MNVLVDSSVWSLALRRRNPPENPVVEELRELIRESRACLIDAVRQEVLSGIRREAQFVRLRETLRFFPALEAGAREHESAAEIFNRCRAKGIQGSNTDFLICAVAQIQEVPILTTDQDFELFAEHCPIRLHPARDRRASSAD